VVFSWFFLLSLLACLVGFSVFFVLAFLTTYNIKHNAPWINQLGKDSSLIVADQHDDFSPPG